MKTSRTSALVSATSLCVSLLLFEPTLSRATHGAAEPATSAPQDLLRPGPEHAMLQKLAGVWDALLIVKDPAGGEHKTRGTLTRSKLAEFHTIDGFRGEFMGASFVGHGINGYCTVKKQFFATWADSMTPSPMTLYGDYDAGKRELRLSGHCFGMTGKLEPCRTVTRFVDDNHFNWALFGPGPDGKEVQHLAIEYTRKR